MNRTDIINYLATLINAKNYLEIGVDQGNNFHNVVVENKIGVDPNTDSKATVYKTSDEFFQENKDNFDIILVDGLHTEEQVYRDINNSINILNENGYIVCHDMNPDKEEYQIPFYNGGIWFGDCWKAFVKLRAERSDLKMCVIDTDCGCGIISRGSQKLLSIDCELNWENFSKNKKNWLNLISVEDFFLLPS